MMKSFLMMILCTISLESTDCFHPLSSRRVHVNRHTSTNVKGGSRQPKIQLEANLLALDDKEILMKAEMTKAYDICKYVTIGASSIILFMADKTNGRLLSKKVAGSVGFALASGISYILAGANDHDRLGSDTYKRLNIGLLGFSAFGLFAWPGEAAFLSDTLSFSVVSMTIAFVKGLVGIVAFKGWKRGVDLDKPLVQEMFEGTKSTLAGLWFTKKRGAAYRNPLVLVILALITSFFEGVFFFNNNLPKLDASLWWSGTSRLFLIATMMYSLKDAAERDRLEGTTFIQLNFMIFLWLFLVGLAQSAGSNVSIDLQKVTLLTFSPLFLIEACRYQYEKTVKDKNKK